MAKIHTHYDNLKVARLAPQEVIRAAYKALSQKYHPDKNPGDEKAARIMAIVNSAYNTLSDPVRRKEHDEWIAAEEWEIEWLESTRHDDGRERPRTDDAWEPEPVGALRPRRGLRDPAWWFGLGAGFAAGCVAGAVAVSQYQLAPFGLVPAPQALARPAVKAVPQAAPDAALARPGQEPAAASWAAEEAQAAAPAPAVRALAVTQLVVPPHSPDCDTDLFTLTAPNGEPWPAVSGYVEGYPVGNRGDEMQVQVDNSANSSPVFVKVYDLDRRSNVRHAFVRAQESLTIDRLAAGRYEVRYQNVEAGGDRTRCPARAAGMRHAGAGVPEI